MNEVILGDGTCLEAVWCGAEMGVMSMLVFGFESLRAAAEKLGNRDNTARVTFRYGEMEDCFEGYTRLFLLRYDTDSGSVLASMEREAAA